MKKTNLEQFEKDKELMVLALLDELRLYKLGVDYKYLLNTLAKTLRAYGINEVSKKSGISRQTISSITNRRSNPRQSTVMQIIKSISK